MALRTAAVRTRTHRSLRHIRACVALVRPVAPRGVAHGARRVAPQHRLLSTSSGAAASGLRLADGRVAGSTGGYHSGSGRSGLAGTLTALAGAGAVSLALGVHAQEQHAAAEPAGGAPLPAGAHAGGGTGRSTASRPADASLPDVVERAFQSTVMIRVGRPGGFFGETQQTGAGSGFIISEDGLVITNYHVAEPGSRLVIRLDDGTEYAGHVKGGDKHSDISLVQIDGARGRRFTPIPLGSSSTLRRGQAIAVLGSPMGMEASVSYGIVASRIRHASDFNMHVNYGTYSMLQVDASMLPGNSGGPIIDATTGEVVGVANMIAGQPGIGMISYGVPIDTAKPVIEGLRKYGKIRRNYLGMTLVQLTEDVVARERKRASSRGRVVATGGFPVDVSKGVLITDVASGSPAEIGGLQPGDVVLEVDGQQVVTTEALMEAVGLYEEDRKISVKVARPVAGAAMSARREFQIKPRALELSAHRMPNPRMRRGY